MPKFYRQEVAVREADWQEPRPSGDEEAAWYVVHTHSRQEARVELGLQARGLEVSLPRITVRRRRRDRFQLLEVPLFSGYLFVHSILSPPAYYHIIKQPGVVCILGSKGRYTPVSAETVASIQTVQESGRSFSPWSKLVPGRRVRVVAGPLGGAVGTIWRGKPARRRLVVGLELLGRSVAVDLEEECVEPFF